MQMEIYLFAQAVGVVFFLLRSVSIRELGILVATVAYS